MMSGQSVTATLLSAGHHTIVAGKYIFFYFFYFLYVLGSFKRLVLLKVEAKSSSSRLRGLKIGLLVVCCLIVCYHSSVKYYSET